MHGLSGRLRLQSVALANITYPRKKEIHQGKGLLFSRKTLLTHRSSNSAQSKDDLAWNFEPQQAKSSLGELSADLHYLP